MFCVVEREENRQKKMITGIYKFGFFLVQKRPFRDTQLLSKKRGPETPIFIVFFVCALFGPSCKKGKFWTSRQKKRKFSLITEKLIFEYFWFFSCFFCFFFFLFFFGFVVFFVFFGGFKGHVRWPEGPPHLGPKPSLFVFLFLFCFCFVLFFCFLFWRV